MRHFPILQFLWGGGGGGGGGGVKILPQDCNLEKKKKEQQTFHPPENKDKARESQNMSSIWGEMGWGEGGGS